MTIEANTRLSGLKFAVGFASHSQAVVSEAANNLGDALGSFVTIIGTRLSQKKNGPAPSLQPLFSMSALKLWPDPSRVCFTRKKST
ncbi:cation transporter [Allobaculum sp. JKK-2023]|uniref:cation transporter n=1 Tax=Allobaculum sp. JKK-2023 TaxID=3108943 RepID=UPI003A599B0A